MAVPDKIYVREYPDVVAHYWEEREKDLVATISHEYIRKDIVDETIKTAEDHAYFAGQEKFREKLIEWAKENIDSLGRLSYGELVNKLNSM